jgi:hypothetical protein
MALSAGKCRGRWKRTRHLHKQCLAVDNRETGNLLPCVKSFHIAEGQRLRFIVVDVESSCPVHASPHELVRVDFLGEGRIFLHDLLLQVGDTGFGRYPEIKDVSNGRLLVIDEEAPNFACGSRGGWQGHITPSHISCFWVTLHSAQALRLSLTLSHIDIFLFRHRRSWPRTARRRSCLVRLTMAF